MPGEFTGACESCDSVYTFVRSRYLLSKDFGPRDEPTAHWCPRVRPRKHNFKSNKHFARSALGDAPPSAH